MELSQIGYFSKAHGVKGQLVLRAESDFKAEGLKALFIEVAGARAPYFISALKENSNGYIVSLEDVDSVEKARPLLGKKIWIDASLLIESAPDLDWRGFEVIDRHHGALGNITEMTDNGQQVLLSIDHHGKEVILPAVDEFIEKVDEKAKKVYFNAPEGLIDVYLGAD